ncbi:hypothetical protein JG688_00011483 [Phytophthora aleatoria]|uniref:Uncharacterized protein n=1 Tax=Phytophthora aleatoria TaxID=2496075 RepID=A0A8J5ITJ6_9STRA|nr:hypothetical protein JG688_00011483 [Phytophthora aleatoria]
MPARCKSVELSIKKRSIESIATEGGSVPPRAEAHFPGQGNRWRLEGAGRRPVLGEAEDTLVPFEGEATREWVAQQASQLFHDNRTRDKQQ